MALQQQGRFAPSVSWWARVVGIAFLAAAGFLGLAGAGNAEARLVRGTMTLKVKTVPADIPPEEQVPGAPTTGKALYGRLTSASPACERNRPLIGLFEHPPYDEKEPLVRKLYYADGETPVTTKANGSWSTDALGILYSYDRETIRVTVVAKRRGSCARVESPTLRVPAQRLNPCLANNSCAPASSAAARES